jgi:hypothetical protein
MEAETLKLLLVCGGALAAITGYARTVCRTRPDLRKDKNMEGEITSNRAAPAGE